MLVKVLLQGIPALCSVIEFSLTLHCWLCGSVLSDRRWKQEGDLFSSPGLSSLPGYLIKMVQEKSRYLDGEANRACPAINNTSREGNNIKGLRQNRNISSIFCWLNVISYCPGLVPRLHELYSASISLCLCLSPSLPPSLPLFFIPLEGVWVLVIWHWHDFKNKVVSHPLYCHTLCVSVSVFLMFNIQKATPTP